MSNRMKGKIIQVIGPVVDVEFEGSVPAIYNAIEVTNGDKKLVLEVASHLGGGRVKCVAMGPTEGLKRGDDAFDTPPPFSVMADGNGSSTLHEMSSLLRKERISFLASRRAALRCVLAHSARCRCPPSNVL